eukprot:1159547-Pelagomonas_calceolata.AAC.23
MGRHEQGGILRKENEEDVPEGRREGMSREGHCEKKKEEEVTVHRMEDMSREGHKVRKAQGHLAGIHRQPDHAGMGSMARVKKKVSAIACNGLAEGQMVDAWIQREGKAPLK